MIYRTLAVVGAAMGVNAVAAQLHSQETYAKLFEEWLSVHKVAIDESELSHRMEIFAQNHDYIETHNAQSKTYTLGHNEFSHMTNEEFVQYFNLNGHIKPGSLRRNPNGELHVAANKTMIPTSVDWVSAGAVTPVKNQGNCGSCWSFSATGAVEGVYGVTHLSDPNYVLPDLSEQQLVSCDTVDGGCNGGWMDDAFNWVVGNGGLCSESDYPYVSGTTTENESCVTGCSPVAGTDIKGWVDVNPGSVDDLMDAAALQPVSIAIQANQLSFQLYKSGVLDGRCGQNLDHGVLLVGYGTWTDGTPYWKVKNSWGTSWGMDGYILIERSDADLCGVLDAPSYPTF